MAKTKISEYDATAANNTDIDSINIAEGMAPSNVNNALRQQMAHLKTEFYKTGTGNTSLGDGALDSLDGTSPGGSNVAIGKDAGTAITTGDANVAVGKDALKLNTTASFNTAVGTSSLAANTTGANNVAIGEVALTANTTASDNTAVGVSALGSNTTGANNTAFGRASLGANTTASNNTAVGYKALEDMTSSSDFNTAIGGFAGNDVASGAQKNVFVGYNTGTGGGANDNQIVIGSDCTSVGGGYITLGNNSGGRVYNHPYSNATWTRTSDERIKKDIQTNTDCGLDFVNDLRTVTYKWKAPSEHPEDFLSYNADQTEATHTEKMYGFIAQEVKEAMDTHNITDFAGWHTVAGNGDQQGISYEMFVMPLVKAVQELSAEVETLKTKVAALEAE